MTEYVVHSRHDTEVDIDVSHPTAGPIVGKLPTAIIELLPVSGDGTSITLHRVIATAEQKAAVNQIFNTGAIVAMGEWTLVKAPDATEAK